MHLLKNYFQSYKSLIVYLVKFIGCFCVLYYGYLLIFGLSDPRNYYSPFVDHYLNFISPLRRFILWGAKVLLSVFGYDTYYKNVYDLSLVGGRGVFLAEPCTGCGVMSFWIAFVFANKG